MANQKPKKGRTVSNKGMGNSLEREVRAAMFAEPVVKALIEDMETLPGLENPLNIGPNSPLQPKDAYLKIRVPESFKVTLDRVCSKQGVEVASVVRALLHYYIKNYGAFIR